jgi:hypothetical protein
VVNFAAQAAATRVTSSPAQKITRLHKNKPQIRGICAKPRGDTLENGPRSTPGTAPLPHIGKFISIKEFTATSAVHTSLVAVVGVDVEAEDGVYFDRLSAAQGGAELPGAQRGHDLDGHGGGAGLEDLEIF